MHSTTVPYRDGVACSGIGLRNPPRSTSLWRLVLGARAVPRAGETSDGSSASSPPPCGGEGAGRGDHPAMVTMMRMILFVLAYR
jgi:hypothetical protein